MFLYCQFKYKIYFGKLDPCLMQIKRRTRKNLNSRYVFMATILKFTLSLLRNLTVWLLLFCFWIYVLGVGPVQSFIIYIVLLRQDVRKLQKK
jgi:hypothetical protein